MQQRIHHRLASTKTLLIGLIVCGVGSCRGPQPLQRAIKPLHRQQYLAALRESSDPKQAHWSMVAAVKNKTTKQLELADQKLSPRRNPFDANRDPLAVSRGAVIYETHCARCHGTDVDGQGPDALPDHRPKNFHDFSHRLAATLHRGAPRSWFKKIRDGSGELVPYPDGITPAMPAFGSTLSREQIWLVITYLQSLDMNMSKQD